jgi:hypothetical protein
MQQELRAGRGRVTAEYEKRVACIDEKLAELNVKG